MTAEQAALLQKARDSLRAAKLLEADELHDFAVSRAYYAMFYVAEAFLLGDALSFSKHSAVMAAFGERFAKSDPLSAEFHRYLLEAQQSRNVGDYDIGPGLSETQATEQIGRAEKFIQFAELKFPQS